MYMCICIHVYQREATNVQRCRDTARDNPQRGTVNCTHTRLVLELLYIFSLPKQFYMSFDWYTRPSSIPTYWCIVL